MPRETTSDDAIRRAIRRRVADDFAKLMLSSGLEEPGPLGGKQTLSSGSSSSQQLHLSERLEYYATLPVAELLEDLPRWEGAPEETVSVTSDMPIAIAVRLLHEADARVLETQMGDDARIYTHLSSLLIALEEIPPAIAALAARLGLGSDFLPTLDAQWASAGFLLGGMGKIFLSTLDAQWVRVLSTASLGTAYRYRCNGVPSHPVSSPTPRTACDRPNKYPDHMSPGLTLLP